MSFSNRNKIYASIQSVILFLLISAPFTYQMTNNYLGGILGKLAEPSGCPTTLGLFVHSIVFGLVVYGIMIFAPIKRE